MRPDVVNLTAAKLVLDLTDPQELCSAAVWALEGGLDSQALRELAGFIGSDSVEARDLFLQVLIDLNRPVPSAPSAVMFLAGDFAAKILDESISPIEGARQISDLTLRVEGETFPELHTFIYAESEWDERPGDREIFEKGIVSASLDLNRGLGGIAALDDGGHKGQK